MQSNEKKIKPLFWRTGFYGALTEGGVGTLYYSLTNEFVKHNHKVLFASGGPMVLPEGVKHKVIEYSKFYRNLPEVHNLSYNFKSSKNIISIIKENEIDMIYLHHHDFHFGAQLVKKKTNIPIILHVDSVEYWVKKNWGKLYFGNLLKWCEQIEFDVVDAIFVISENLKNQLIEFYNVNPSKIHISPNGVDVEKFKPEINCEEIKNKYKLNDKFIIGYSGVFNEYHGIDILSNAIDILKTQIPYVHFLLIGDGEFRPHLENYIQKNNLERYVTITGLIPFAKMPNYLSCCDVLVSPFKQTYNTAFFNSPIKTFEYMALGKPIVTTKIGQLDKICFDGINSLIMEEDNPVSLAEKIIEIYNNSELSKIISQKAREDAVEKYSWKNNYNRILDTYYKII